MLHFGTNKKQQLDLTMSSEKQFSKHLANYLPEHGIISNDKGSIVLTRCFCPAVESKIDQGNYLKVGLCMSAGGKVRNQLNNITTWRQGELYITGPASSGEFASPDVEMIGLAIDLNYFDSLKAKQPLSSLNSLNSQITSDNLICSILLSLWNSADAYGGDSAFIEQGVLLILQRLTERYQKLQQGQDLVRKLSARQIQKVSDHIDTHLTENIRASELSQLVGMEPKSFANALKATSGYTPYAFIANHRMTVAKQHLTTGSSVTETALSVGYSNPSKFSVAFRRLVGCSPSKWKESKT